MNTKTKKEILDIIHKNPIEYKFRILNTHSHNTSGNSQTFNIESEFGKVQLVATARWNIHQNIQHRITLKVNGNILEEDVYSNCKLIERIQNGSKKTIKKSVKQTSLSNLLNACRNAMHNKEISELTAHVK